jgi:hypothetical protein
MYPERPQGLHHFIMAFTRMHTLHIDPASSTPRDHKTHTTWPTGDIQIPIPLDRGTPQSVPLYLYAQGCHPCEHTRTQPDQPAARQRRPFICMVPEVPK